MLDSNACCGTLRFVVVAAIYFSFQKGRVTCDESYATIYTVHLRLIYEAKIQLLSVFTWKPAKTRYVKLKTKSLLFPKAYNKTRSTRSEVSQIVAENLTNSIKSIKCRHLIRKPYCTSFAIKQG